jgi:DnaJ-class molecular chaperone
MRGNGEVHQWLLEHGSGDRAESYEILGLEVGADMEAVKRRYWKLAREQHPDKRQQSLLDDCNYISDNESFMRIKAAYEHLTKENGVGKQRNPKYEEVKFLENQRMESNLAGSTLSNRIHY